mgnify:CR=1 FL=1
MTLDALAGASDVDAGTVLTVVDVDTLPAGVSYDAATQRFSLDTSNPIFQAIRQDEQRTVAVNYGDSDGIAPAVSTSATWTITGVNVAPVANPVDGRVAGGSAKVNLMLMVDLSGSMAELVASGVSRLDATKAALTNLINLYDGKGDVAVRLVTFGEVAEDIDGRWLSAAEARAEINGFVAIGGTDYDVPIMRAREAFRS